MEPPSHLLHFCRISVTTPIRPSIAQLLRGWQLWRPLAQPSSTKKRSMGAAFQWVTPHSTKMLFLAAEMVRVLALLS